MRYGPRSPEASGRENPPDAMTNHRAKVAMTLLLVNSSAALRMSPLYIHSTACASSRPRAFEATTHPMCRGSSFVDHQRYRAISGTNNRNLIGRDDEAEFIQARHAVDHSR
jgi:hypothetical protein